MKQEVLTNKVIEILLWQYNEKAKHPLIAVESEEIGCFSASLVYTFYRKMEPWDEYKEVARAGESETMMWLAHKLNERDTNENTIDNSGA